VIAKVVHGWRPAGLLAYLFSPGRHEEHRNPRVVASWDGAPWLHQPEKLRAVVLDGEVLQPGEFDLDLRPLTVTMQELARLAGLPVTNPPAITPHWANRLAAGAPLPRDAPPWVRHYRYDPRRKAVVLRPGYVWHCPVRLHPDDPTLSDAQWQQIAQRLMQATGIHQAGCRWIAVRHADDHIHLVATLVSEDTGTRFHPYRDYPKLRTTCQQLERELGLVRTAGADKTAAPAPTRAEKGKAAPDGTQFLAELTAEGLDPRTVCDPAGQVRGYTVALPGDLTADGWRVRYSGSALAPDLTWPKLTTRWASTPAVGPISRTSQGRVAPVERRAALSHATSVADRAAGQVRHRGEDVDGVAHATGEVLAALSRAREGWASGPLTSVAGCYDRAARTPHRVLPTNMGPVARELRLAARRLGAVGALSGRGHEKLATVTLLLALASLITEIAAWQQHHGRSHQATAARTAARTLPTLAHAVATPASTSTDRRPAAHPIPPSTTALPTQAARRQEAIDRPSTRSPGRRPS
jgi:hypothetical protein